MNRKSSILTKIRNEKRTHPGCDLKKSIRLSFPPLLHPILNRLKLNAKASPIANAVTTEEVGAGKTQSASSVKCSSVPDEVAEGEAGGGITRPVPASNHELQPRAKIESGSRVMAIVALTRDRTMGSSRINSAVDPEWEMRSRASQALLEVEGEACELEQGQMTPRSPCKASRGCKKTA